MSTVEEILASSAPAAPEPSPRNRYRAARRRATRALRPGRTPAGVAVAAVLSLLAWAAFAGLAGELFGYPLNLPYAARLLSVTWGHPIFHAAASVMVVAGGVLVVLALIPGRPRLVPLETTDPDLVIGLTRSGLRRTLAAAAWDVPGVSDVSVRFLRKQLEVTVVTDAQRTGELLREVGAAIGDRLCGLGAQCRHEVVVRLRRRGI